MKLASCKSALNPAVVYSIDRSKAVVPVLVLLFVALWFILRGDLLYVFPCVILFLCFSVLLVLRLPRLGKRELILVLFARLFGLCLFRFVGFLFLLESGKGCGLWLWHSLDFSLTFFVHPNAWSSNCENVPSDKCFNEYSNQLRIYAVLSTSSLSANILDCMIQAEQSFWSDARMRRLICIFAGHTCHKVLFW